MQVTPKTEEQVQPLVLPAGEYDAFTRTAKDKVSKSDNEMIELMLSVWDGQGNETMVFDYLLDAMTTSHRTPRSAVRHLPLSARHQLVTAVHQHRHRSRHKPNRINRQHR